MKSLTIHFFLVAILTSSTAYAGAKAPKDSDAAKQQSRTIYPAPAPSKLAAAPQQNLMAPSLPPASAPIESDIIPGLPKNVSRQDSNPSSLIPLPKLSDQGDLSQGDLSSKSRVSIASFPESLADFPNPSQFNNPNLLDQVMNRNSVIVSHPLPQTQPRLAPKPEAPQYPIVTLFGEPMKPVDFKTEIGTLSEKIYGLNQIVGNRGSQTQQCSAPSTRTLPQDLAGKLKELFEEAKTFYNKEVPVCDPEETAKFLQSELMHLTDNRSYAAGQTAVKREISPTEEKFGNLEIPCEINVAEGQIFVFPVSSYSTEEKSKQFRPAVAIPFYHSPFQVSPSEPRLVTEGTFPLTSAESAPRLTAEIQTQSKVAQTRNENEEKNLRIVKPPFLARNVGTRTHGWSKYKIVYYQDPYVGNLVEAFAKGLISHDASSITPLFHDLISAVVQTHQNGVLHGDLKLEHFYTIFEDGRFQARLGGFHKATPFSKIPDQLGAYYHAPEMKKRPLRLSEINFSQVEAYALGSTLGTLLGQEHADKPCDRATSKNSRLPHLEKLACDLRNADPNVRLTPQQALKELESFSMLGIK